MSRAVVWLEDIAAGQTFETPAVEVDAQSIVAFASRYDPQPFHTDPAAAAQSVFGGLVASGWQTAALSMRLLVDHGPRIGNGLIGLGFEQLRWGPLRPGDRVRVRGEVVDVRPSRQHSDRGIVRLRLATLNQSDEPVQEGICSLLVMARPAEGAAAPEG